MREFSLESAYTCALIPTTGYRRMARAVRFRRRCQPVGPGLSVSNRNLKWPAVRGLSRSSNTAFSDVTTSSKVAAMRRELSGRVNSCAKLVRVAFEIQAARLVPAEYKSSSLPVSAATLAVSSVNLLHSVLASNVTHFGSLLHSAPNRLTREGRFAQT